MACTYEDVSALVQELYDIEQELRAFFPNAIASDSYIWYSQVISNGVPNVVNVMVNSDSTGGNRTLTFNQTESMYLLMNLTRVVFDKLIKNQGLSGKLSQVAEILQQGCELPEPSTPTPECFDCNTDLVNKLRTLINETALTIKTQ